MQTGKFTNSVTLGLVFVALSCVGDEMSEQTSTQELGQLSIAEGPGLEDPIQDVGAAWDEFMDEHAQNLQELNDEQRELLKRIALARVRDEGGDALNSIVESLPSEDQRIGLIDSLLADLVQNDPQLAFDGVLCLSQKFRRSYLRDVAWNWAKFDPQSALDHIYAVVLDIDQREELSDAVIRKWAAQSPKEILENLNELPTESQSHGKLEAFRFLSMQAPETAATMIGVIEDPRNRQTIARKVARNWLKRDVSEAMGWVQTSPELEAIRRQVLEVVLPDLAESDSNLAFNTALQHPIQESEVGLEVFVILKLAFTDTDQALVFLQNVRSGASKVAAYTAVGTKLGRDGELDRGLELASELPEPTRETYSASVVADWGFHNPSEVADRMDYLSTEDLKKRVALMAVIGSGLFDVQLSSEHLERLKGYLSDRQMKFVEEWYPEALESSEPK